MTLSPIQKKQLKHIIQSNEWDIVILLVSKLINKWNLEKTKRDSEFETIWATAQKEAKVEALNQFISILEQEGNIYD